MSFGTMTGHEKKLNKGDLHNYKKIEPQLQAMIPGIHNLSTVGSSPLKRGLRREDYDLKQKQLIEKEKEPGLQYKTTSFPQINTTKQDARKAYDLNSAGQPNKVDAFTFPTRNAQKS